MDDVFELDAVTKSAAGSNYWVLECNASEADGEVGSASDGGGGSGHRGCSVTRGADESKTILKFGFATVETPTANWLRALAAPFPLQ